MNSQKKYQNQSSCKNKHGKVYELPMYFVWSLIPYGMRRVYCQFAFGLKRPEVDVVLIADMEWLDVPKDLKKLIMAYMKQAADAKLDILQEPGRIPFTPIERPREQTELEKTWPQ